MTPVVAWVHLDHALGVLQRQHGLARHVVMPGEVHGQQQVHRIAGQGRSALLQRLHEATRCNECMGVPVVRGRVVVIERQRVAEEPLSPRQINVVVQCSVCERGMRFGQFGIDLQRACGEERSLRVCLVRLEHTIFPRTERSVDVGDPRPRSGETRLDGDRLLEAA